MTNRTRVEQTPIALIGLSGSGKSTLGPLVAARLGVPHHDVDQELERRQGRTIREIFATDGEPHFRRLESDLTRELLGQGGVLSLGGGAPLTPAVADALAGHPVVWLRVDPDSAARRIGVDENRPLLVDGDAGDRLRRMLAERSGTYDTLATLSLDTDGLDADALVRAIAAHAASFAPSPRSGAQPAGLRGRLVARGYERGLRPLFFAGHGGDPEAIHEDMIAALALLGAMPGVRGLVGALTASPTEPVTVAGVRFPGRIGLAAGMDKDGRAALAWQHLGFAFAELGTVTALPQPGNPRPRVFRAPSSRGLVNRMGFNNAGALALANRLSVAGVLRGNGRAGIPLGISLGKSKATALDDAVADYLSSLRSLAAHADYIAINVSSPNTPGLRSLQDGGALAELLAALINEARVLAPGREPVPIFVKIAPDLTWGQVDEVLATVTDAGASGIIATNTTLARERLAPADAHLATEPGGLSGAPLTARAREVVGYVAAHTDLPVIGSGGVMTAGDAGALLDAGASLVQLYTGFVYAGPALIAASNARR